MNLRGTARVGARHPGRPHLATRRADPEHKTVWPGRQGLCQPGPGSGVVPVRGSGQAAVEEGRQLRPRHTPHSWQAGHRPTEEPVRPSPTAVLPPPGQRTRPSSTGPWDCSGWLRTPTPSSSHPQVDGLEGCRPHRGRHPVVRHGLSLAGGAAADGEPLQGQGPEWNTSDHRLAQRFHPLHTVSTCHKSGHQISVS